MSLEGLKKGLDKFMEDCSNLWLLFNHFQVQQKNAIEYQQQESIGGVSMPLSLDCEIPSGSSRATEWKRMLN